MEGRMKVGGMSFLFFFNLKTDRRTICGCAVTKIAIFITILAVLDLIPVIKFFHSIHNAGLLVSAYCMYSMVSYLLVFVSIFRNSFTLAYVGNFMISLAIWVYSVIGFIACFFISFVFIPNTAGSQQPAYHFKNISSKSSLAVFISSWATGLALNLLFNYVTYLLMHELKEKYHKLEIQSIDTKQVTTPKTLQVRKILDSES